MRRKWLSFPIPSYFDINNLYGEHPADSRCLIISVTAKRMMGKSVVQTATAQCLQCGAVLPLSGKVIGTAYMRKS